MTKKLTRTELEALPDSDLIELVGTKVMKWKKRKLPFLLYLVSGDLWVWDTGEGWKRWIDCEWNPVEQWADAFRVAGEVQMKISLICDAFLDAKSGDANKLRRSLCIAALLALSK